MAERIRSATSARRCASGGSRRSPSGTASRGGRAPRLRPRAARRGARRALDARAASGSSASSAATTPARRSSRSCTSTDARLTRYRARRRRRPSRSTTTCRWRRRSSGARCRSCSAGARWRSTCGSLMGRQLAEADRRASATYARRSSTRYAIPLPDPARPADADRVRAPRGLAGVAAVAGRRMDGGALYLHLRRRPGHTTPTTASRVSPTTDKDALDEARPSASCLVRAAASPAAGGRDDAWDAGAPGVPLRGSAPRRRRREGARRRGVHRRHAGLVQLRRRSATPTAARRATPTRPPEATTRR